MANGYYEEEEAGKMRTRPPSLPPGDGVVVLDEGPSVKGDGLGLPGRLLVDGCEGKGGGGGAG